MVGLTSPLDLSAVGLVYVRVDAPGFRRERRGRGFAYFDPAGGLVRDENLRRRFARLAIPPAWKEVWICPEPLGHIQAVARDAKGRKQYRYHEAWRAFRDEAKFDRMPAFGAALPRIRRRIERDLDDRGAVTRALAAVAALLDRGALRIGSSDDYDGIGAATLEKAHVCAGRERLRLQFVGKGGRTHDVVVTDRRLARAVRDLQCLPGQRLFQVAREDGAFAPVTSGDVNDYLERVAGDRFTAKEFRTWAAGVAACQALLDPDATPSLKAAVAAAAARLGNTPAIARKSYVHPAVLELAGNGLRPPRLRPGYGLAAAERSFLAAIERPIEPTR